MKSDDDKIGITIIESLIDEVDKKTGTELYNDTIAINKLKYDNLFSLFFSVSSKDELFDALSNILEEVRNGNKILILHFETHGSINGLQLSNGELIGWKEIFTYTKEINVLVDNCLLIILGLCSGNAIISAINPKEQAPFRGVLGVFREISQVELLNALGEFYNAFLVKAKFDHSIELMNKQIEKAENHFQMITSEECFDKIVNPDYNKHQFEQQMNQLAFKTIIESPNLSKEDFERIKKELTEHTKAELKKIKDNKDYFMIN